MFVFIIYLVVFRGWYDVCFFVLGMFVLLWCVVIFIVVNEWCCFVVLWYLFGYKIIDVVIKIIFCGFFFYMNKYIYDYWMMLKNFCEMFRDKVY